jgi:hypothetical protein
MLPFTSFWVTHPRTFIRSYRRTALPPYRPTANFEVTTPHIPAPAEPLWSCSSDSSPPSLIPTAS